MLTVKRAAKGDLAQIKELNDECLPIKYPLDFYYDLCEPNRRCILLKTSDRQTLIGASTIALKGNEAYLMTMGVAEAWRGRGYGKILLQETINQVKQEERIAKLRLHVLADNEVAIKLYQEMGFVCKSVDSHYYNIGGQMRTAWAMEMRLRMDQPPKSARSLIDRFRSLLVMVN